MLSPQSFNAEINFYEKIDEFILQPKTQWGKDKFKVRDQLYYLIIIVIRFLFV